MSVGDSRVVAAGERAFETLRQRGIPPSPENYLIWYTHYADENPALSRMIRLLEQNRDSFGPERCRELYSRYFLREDVDRAMTQAMGRIRTITEHLATVLARSSDESARASANLEALGKALTKSTDIGQIRRLIATLDAETRALIAGTRALGCQLQRYSREASELHSHLEALQREAETDALTGVANRKGFDRALRELATRSLEEGVPLALLVVDVDHFKQFNDTHGHDVGDAVLRLVAGRIRDGLREADVVARYGGEEFVVLMPGVGLADAIAAAERLRAAVAARRLRSRTDGSDLGAVTVSIGVALYRPGEPLDHLFRRADHALYIAKRTGRNRVVCGEDATEPQPQDRISVPATSTA